MSQIMKKISGRLTGVNGAVLTQVPMDISVELTTLSGSPGGWIGSAVVNSNDAFFELLTAYNIQENEPVTCRIKKGNLTIQTSTVSIIDFYLSPSLSQAAYDALFKEEVTGYTTISGKVTLGEKNIAAIPAPGSNLQVSVNKPSFRSNEIIATGILDEHGFYEIKVPNHLFRDVTASCQEIPLPELNVSLYSGEQLIAGSVPVQPEHCCNTADLHVCKTEFFSLFRNELDYYLDTLSELAGISENELPSVTLSGDDAELPALAATTNLDASRLFALIRSASIASDTGIILAHSYALYRKLEDNVVLWALLDQVILAQMIDNAGSAHVIPFGGSVADTYAKLQNFRAGTAGAEMDGDGQSVREIVEAIAADPAEAATFLKLTLANGNAEVTAFWSVVGIVLGEEAKVRLQEGVRLLGITGMQPEITKKLQQEVSETSLRGIAVNWGTAEWYQLIDATCRQEGKLCVPATIRGEATDPEAHEPKMAYAQTLRELVQDIFATDVIGKKIAGGAFPDVITDAEQTSRFIMENPGRDLREQNIWDFDFPGSDYPEAVRTGLLPVQNLLRLTGGKPDAVAAMLEDGLQSSADIADMDEESFIKRYTVAIPVLSTTVAQQLYGKASYTNLLLSNIKANIQPNNNLTAVLTEAKWSNWLTNPGPSTNPDLQTLFGSLDLCSCTECMSMYSPAAYYTDILNLIKNKLGTPSKPYEELDRRRRDLFYIDLTCKNTNTSIPYIDLVNEQMELMVLRTLSGVTIPFESYQTTGTAEELAAYPEHTYRTGDTYHSYSGYEQVYDEVLSSAVYPGTLPFNLPLEESRTYLGHLGYKRLELMQQFKPADAATVSGTPGINDINLLAEGLKLSRAEVDIITTEISNGPADGRFYGFDPVLATWAETLCAGEAGQGLNTLLERSGITYIELLQLLDTGFLNKVNGAGVRPLEIISINPANPASCQLEELNLKANVSATEVQHIFRKWHRFLRLKRATGWSINQLDKVLHSFEAIDISKAVFMQVARTHQLVAGLGIVPDQLCALWNHISTAAYINYHDDKQGVLPSVYDNLFRNKSLINPPEAYFDDEENINGTYQTRSGTLVAAFRITEEELFQLLTFLGVSITSQVTWKVLSRIYGLSGLSQGLKLPVSDLLRFFALHNLDGAAMLALSTPATLQELFRSQLELIQSDRKQLFSLDELEYLLLAAEPNNVFTPAAASIQLFYESLRAELKKILGEVTALVPGSDLEKTLKNTVLQYFVTQFSIDAGMSAYLVGEAITLNTGAQKWVDALIRPDFINALDTAATNPLTPLPVTENGSIPGLLFSELYNAFRVLHKTAMVVMRYKLSDDEVAFFHDHTGMDVLDITSLPVMTGSPSLILLQQLSRLDDWMRVKGQFHIPVADFIALLEASLGNTKQTWHEKVLLATGWKAEDLELLVGDSNTLSNAGLLVLDYTTNPATNDFRKGALLLQLKGIFEAAKRIGLTPEVTYAALRTDIAMQHARNVRKAAKAKHKDAEWSAIAKPLQDTLRERQRQALVAYIVVRKDLVAGNGMLWKNRNDLFSFLLMDVEMQPCMKTSRIKQGINSLQLYMDRIILNLENKNGLLTDHITISPAMTEQWKQWRKWYRIWEANRKIFLYPENWIEPELRDDKTPFFKELETQILQEEIKANTAEDALRAYLEKVEEVGRLEPVSSYHQIEKNSLGEVITDRIHVFGKTAALPHRYYYRRLENKEWSPWEKVNADIKSDHVVPVMWNRKLYLFWLTFKLRKGTDAERQRSIFSDRSTGRTGWSNAVNGENHSPVLLDDARDDSYSHWDITLNWSRYKDDKWLATELSKDTMSLDMSKVLLSKAAKASFSNAAQAKQAFSWLSNRGALKADDLFKNRLYLYATPEGFSPDDNGMAGINFSIMFTPGLDETATGLYTFIWRGDNSQSPYVPRNTYERGYQLMSPAGTRLNRMKFAEDPSGDGKLYRDTTSFLPVLTPDNTNLYYSFDSNGIHTARGITRSGKNVVFNTTTNNGAYEITARGSINGNSDSHYHNPMLSEFMYEDTVNTFFVTWEPKALAGTVINGLNLQTVSLGTALQMTNINYPVNVSQPVTVNIPPTPVIYQQQLPSAYRFQTFYHAQIHQFIKALNREGIDGLLAIGNQKPFNTMNFVGNYQPTALVHSKHPTNSVQFDFSEAYSIYNWELFFHAPMMIAQRLSGNQQFEDAQKWYHYIFNPTSNTDVDGNYTGGIKRFWKFYPFYNEAQQPIETLYDLLMAINNGNTEAEAQVYKWEQHPFKPHVIARMRIMAYMKNVLMKYLDNLIAWGDQLFRRDTIESINEATQLYVLAANLLGTRPQEIPPRGAPADPMNFLDLDDSGLDLLSNALVNIESFFAPNTGTPVSTGNTGNPVYGKMFYFCLPKNDRLMGYWDTVADRLFKIRNCMNIDGSVRQLPLFEPPIDPALLVRAAALGVDMNSILDNVSGGNLPHYRFAYMLQKANEFSSEVRGLGSALLSALEKKDAEQLSLLRSGQERQLLEQVRLVKEAYVAEAEASLESTRLAKENTQQRFQYYSTRSFTNNGEQKHLQSLQEGMILQAVQAGMQSSASALSIIPQFHLQAIASGTTFGGQQLSAAMNAVSANLGVSVAINNNKGYMALTQAGYERRRDDWKFQADTAAKELEQIDKQVLSAEIRLDIARRELSNHELQMEQQAETDAFMRSKFTSQQLYSWMSSQLATTYFQSYQLAYDLAKRAETCYRYELPLTQKPQGGFIQFGYWDSLRKGLMSGEKLQFDLRKMETSYMEDNRRELELRKTFSLAMINPEALVQLRREGQCSFNLEKTWYDLDFPGHYLRKIRSVSLSIPCVAGPYTTVASRLILDSNLLHKSADPAVQPEVVEHVAVEAIATSSAQNDAGVFELNFRDERYVPFENAGAVSNWTLRMMDRETLRQFDYDTISDVLIHVQYTARHDESRVAAVKDALEEQLNALSTGIDLPRYFSLKHEYSNNWFAAFRNTVPVGIMDDAGRSFTFSLDRDQFPSYVKGKTIRITSARFHLKTKEAIPSGTVYKLWWQGQGIDIASESIAYGDVAISNLSMAPGTTEVPFSFVLYKEGDFGPEAVTEAALSDLYLVLTYTLG